MEIKSGKNENKRLVKKHAQRGIEISWGENVGAQNNMTDPESSYNHITKTGANLKTSKKRGDHIIVYRGKYNHAPQKDIELGKKSITQRKIASKIARLVAGDGFEFSIREPENDDRSLTQEEQQQIDKANEWLKNGLADSLKTLANGIVYHSLSSLIITQSKPEFSEATDSVETMPEYFAAQPSERLRFSESIMNEKAQEVTEYHYYHKTWNFTGNCERDNKVRLPNIIPLNEYQLNSSKGLRPNDAFCVATLENDKAKSERFASVAIGIKDGIFDGAYPLPQWKTNSSINDVENEFQASVIRTDFLRNGLHIFAVVNVYSHKFNVTTENDDYSPDEEWAEQLSVVQSLKRSHNSGKVIVNALGTQDPDKDGKIEIEKIDLNFPVEVYKSLNEEAKAGILTGWGAAADLFGVSKPEANNLRSQEGFLKMAILMLKEDVSIFQKSITDGIDWILNYYKLDKVKSHIKAHDSALFLVVMAEFAKEYLFVNEIREKILGQSAWDDEELARFIEEKSKLAAAPTINFNAGDGTNAPPTT